jgi:hypothetical protein
MLQTLRKAGGSLVMTVPKVFVEQVCIGRLTGFPISLFPSAH